MCQIIISLEMSKYTYTFNSESLPKSSLETNKTRTYRYNTRTRNIPTIPKHKLKIVNNSFLTQSTKIWLTLPQNIRNSSNPRILNNKLKVHMINSY